VRVWGDFSLQKRGRPPRPRESDFVTGEELEDDEEEGYAEAERLAPQRAKRKREASAAAAAAAEDLTLIGKRLLLSASVALVSLERGLVRAVSGNLPLGFGRSAAVY
jgi:hypothetical protein